MNMTMEEIRHKIHSIMIPNFLTKIEYICGYCGDFITIEKKTPGNYAISQNFIFLMDLQEVDK